jgi:hypothetical protein
LLLTRKEGETAWVNGHTTRPVPKDPGEPLTMSFQLSRRDVDSAYAYANRNLGRMRRDPDSSESGVLNKLLNAGEIVAGAAAVGVASGRFGPLNIAGTAVPLDAVGGVALHLVGFWLDSSLSRHLHNLGSGVLAGYATKAGVGLGTSLRTKAGLSPVSVSGTYADDDVQSAYDIIGAQNPLHMTGAAQAASPLTEAELAALAQQVR